MEPKLFFLPLNEIKVGTRQRGNMGSISDLVQSIQEIGLIHPIVVWPVSDQDGTTRYELIAGHRRLEAFKSLNNEWPDDPRWKLIPATDRTDAPEEERKIIELEENVRRRSLHWKDQAMAVLQYEQLIKKYKPGVTSDEIANRLVMSPSSLSAWTSVAEELETDPTVAVSETFTAAYNYIARKKERLLEGVINEITAVESEPQLEPSPASTFSILNEDFKEAAASWKYPRANLVHCDFPYGHAYGVPRYVTTRRDLTDYEDSPDTFFGLLDVLLKNQDKLLQDSCHLLFWLSMSNYSDVVDALRTADFRVNPFPLIWGKSDNKGAVPDPRRGPRRNYEVALLASRGDRKIVSPVSGLVYLPTSRDRKEHVSEKPVPVLRHFFRMLVDKSTEILDPTCGSGTALVAAKQLGAMSGIGMDILAEFCELSRLNLSRPGDTEPLDGISSNEPDEPD